MSAKNAGEDIRSKTGGAYIPPAKLRLMQEQITDKSSESYQVTIAKLLFIIDQRSI